MASQASLISLPMEVFSMVASQLDFVDICNLRLTARELVAKTSTETFKARFVTKSVHISREHLQNFNVVTQSDWMGCRLQHLTIVGIVPLLDRDSHKVHKREDLDEEEDFDEQEDDVDEYEDVDQQENLELLSQALKNLRVNSDHGHLFSLNLVIKCQAKDDTLAPTLPTRENTAAIVCRHEWKHIWQCAGDTARLVALAVQSSAIPVEKLDLYGTIPRCALSSHRLGSIIDLIDIYGLKSLSLTVSANENHEVEHEGLAEHIRHLIVSSPELEHLEVRYFDVCRMNLSDAEQEERRFFDRIAELSIPRLTSVSLKGIRTSETALLSFLSKHSHLRQISFEELHLEQGEFRPVFAYINEHLQLDLLYLNDLWANRLVQFPGSPGKGHYPHPGGP